MLRPIIAVAAAAFLTLALAASEASFRHEDLVVYQFQLAKRNNVIPLTRDYVNARKAGLRQTEATALLRPLQDNQPDNDLDLSLGSFDFWRGSVGATFRF